MAFPALASQWGLPHRHSLGPKCGANPLRRLVRWRTEGAPACAPRRGPSQHSLGGLAGINPGHCQRADSMGARTKRTAQTLVHWRGSRSQRAVDRLAALIRPKSTPPSPQEFDSFAGHAGQFSRRPHGCPMQRSAPAASLVPSQTTKRRAKRRHTRWGRPPLGP